MEPTDMSGGMERGNTYPEWTKSQLLLLLIWKQLQKAFDSGESELRVAVRRAGGEGAGVQLGYTSPVSVSDEIPELERGGEAVAVFERLRKEKYLLGEFGRGGPYTYETPVLYGLSTKGMVEIGKFPDPDKRLAAAFATAYRAIEQEPDIPDPEKKEILGTLEKMSSRANNVHGLGEAVLQGLSQGT